MNLIFVFGIVVIIVLILLILYKLFYSNVNIIVPNPNTGCPANTYLKKGVCVPCPSGYISDEGSVFLSDCKCDKGYYQDGYNCTKCPNGSSTNYVGSSSKSQCICNDQGSYLDNDVCTRCPIGTYINDDHTVCNKCPNNRLTSGYGSLSINDCLCPDGSSNNGPGLSTGIGNCKCNDINYIWNSAEGKCQNCPAGDVTNTGQQTIYQTGNPNNRWCRCGTYEYWNAVSRSCLPYLAYSP